LLYINYCIDLYFASILVSVAIIQRVIPFRCSVGPLVGSALTDAFSFEWMATVSFLFLSRSNQSYYHVV